MNFYCDGVAGGDVGWPGAKAHRIISNRSVETGRRIFRPAQACQPSDVCAIPQVRATYKIIFWVVAALVLIALVFPYVLPLFY